MVSFSRSRSNARPRAIVPAKAIATHSIPVQRRARGGCPAGSEREHDHDERSEEHHRGRRSPCYGARSAGLSTRPACLLEKRHRSVRVLMIDVFEPLVVVRTALFEHELTAAQDHTWSDGPRIASEVVRHDDDDRALVAQVPSSAPSAIAPPRSRPVNGSSRSSRATASSAARGRARAAGPCRANTCGTAGCARAARGRHGRARSRAPSCRCRRRTAPRRTRGSRTPRARVAERRVREHPDLAAHVAVRDHRVPRAKHQRAVTRPHERRHDAEQRGLAGAVVAEQRAHRLAVSSTLTPARALSVP